jgi:hypothetical protein
MMRGARVAGVGLWTGWGEGPGALPQDARVSAAGRAVVPLARPQLEGERFRRATRECLLGVAAIHALLADAGLEREAIHGEDTALLFVTAGAYGASNAEFVGGRSATLHFPYTAPSAMSGEVAIEFGLRGAYVILIGGAPATVDALWQASRLLAEGRCRRALVLAVETFGECEALWRRARWTLPRPLVETAACVLLVPDATPAVYRAAASAGRLEAASETRAGCTLSAAPLVGLALARAAGEEAAHVTGTWRGRTAGIDLALAGHVVRA